MSDHYDDQNLIKKNARPGHHRPGPTTTNPVTGFGRWATRYSCLGSYVASAAAQPLSSPLGEERFIFIFTFERFIFIFTFEKKKYG